LAAFWGEIENRNPNFGMPAPRRSIDQDRSTGLCHTDMVARDKGYPVPQPIVLGHEGAGIVESVGADVVKVAPGDSVVLTFLTCGRCKPCRLGRMAHCEKTFPLCCEYRN